MTTSKRFIGFHKKITDQTVLCQTLTKKSVFQGCLLGAIKISLIPGTNEAGHGSSNTEPRQSVAKISPTARHLLFEAHQPQYSTPAHSLQVVSTLHSGTAERRHKQKMFLYYILHFVFIFIFRCHIHLTWAVARLIR